MLSTRISLLERFGICSVLIPYYGSAHQSFLLLSKLSRNSREMLDSFYDEFMKLIDKNTICVTIDEKWHEKMLFLPWNLFRFEIIINWETLVNAFLKLVDNIHNKEGYFFQEHYMHSRLCIDALRLNEDFVQDLYHSLEIMKWIEVIDYIDRKYFKFYLL